MMHKTHDMFRILNIEFQKLLDIDEQHSVLIRSHEIVAARKLKNTMQSSVRYMKTLMHDCKNNGIRQQLFIDNKLMDRRHCLSIRSLASFKFYLQTFGLPDVLLFGEHYEGNNTSYDYASILILFCIENKLSLPIFKVAATSQQFKLEGVTLLQLFEERCAMPIQ